MVCALVINWCFIARCYRSELEDLKLSAEQTVASRMVFETDTQVRNTLLNVERFAKTASLSDGFESAAAEIQVNT